MPRSDLHDLILQAGQGVSLNGRGPLHSIAPPGARRVFGARRAGTLEDLGRWTKGGNLLSAYPDICCGE